MTTDQKKVTIEVTIETRKQLNLYKINNNLKSMDQAIGKLLKGKEPSQEPGEVQ